MLDLELPVGINFRPGFVFASIWLLRHCVRPSTGNQLTNNAHEAFRILLPTLVATSAHYELTNICLSTCVISLKWETADNVSLNTGLRRDHSAYATLVKSVDLTFIHSQVEE